MKCKWYESHHCQSCTLLNDTYQASLVKKENDLRSLFNGAELKLEEVVVCDPVEASRGKAKFAVCGKENTFEFGFYDSQLNFKTLEECPLHMVGINELLADLKTRLKKYHIIPYDLHSKKGELKYLIISKSLENQEILVRFVVRSKESLDRLKKLAQEWILTSQEVKVVSLNIQPEHKAILEGDEEIILTQETSINCQLGDVHLNLGVRSFFQVTPSVSLRLYQTVRQVLTDNNINSFLDLYCGVGAFSFFAAQTCQSVLGVEISKEAIEAAKLAVTKNKILSNIEFQSLDVDKFLLTQTESFDAILVNPPRRGLNESIISRLLELRPQMIIYSSCQALTLSRDVKMLEAHYSINRTQIFDMFPFTDHYETLMILVRKE